MRGRQRNQAGARDTKKEAGETQTHNDEFNGLACVARCAERYGAAEQGGRKNASRSEATH